MGLASKILHLIPIAVYFKNLFIINVAKDKYADMFDANDEAAVFKGCASGTEVELCIISKLELWRIVRTEVDENCEKIDETIFDCEDTSKTIELVKLNGEVEFSMKLFCC
jgi:hypothetical protein